jgi:dipeptidase E
MKRLVLHSNQIAPEADKVERGWLALLEKAHPIIGYIPSSGDPERFFLRAQEAYYARHGVKIGVYFELEVAEAMVRLSIKTKIRTHYVAVFCSH